MTLKLQLIKELRVPIDAGCICPDTFAGKSLNEIAELQIWEGNRKRLLNSLFELKGDSQETFDETNIHLTGNLSRVQRIGAGMKGGEITVQGDVGMHLGEKMLGGTIMVEGNAGSWTGSAMKGGTIIVKKNAGDYIGGAYRGSTKGMQGGTIIIHGDAGTEVGCYMRNGLIKIQGNVAQFVGIRMRNGTIVVQGSAAERAGAFMTGGKIIICNNVTSILPSFSIDSIKSKAKAEGEAVKGPFYLFIGDLADHGNGKLYVSKNKNEYLKSFEEFL